jgi:16S rRNA G1207 methylase RsmC
MAALQQQVAAVHAGESQVQEQQQQVQELSHAHSSLQQQLAAAHTALEEQRQLVVSAAAVSIHIGPGEQFINWLHNEKPGSARTSDFVGVCLYQTQASIHSAAVATMAQAVGCSPVKGRITAVS